MLCPIIPVAATSYTDAAQPLPVRQEKARLLLHLVSHVSEDFSHHVPLMTETDMQQFENLMERLTRETSGTFAVTRPAERFAVSVLMRHEMLDNLDFSDKAVRRFFEINPTRYNCLPRAEISEFVVPTVWLEETATTRTLAEIEERLEVEPFERVAFEVTSRFTTATLPRRYEATADKVEEVVFQKYRQAADAGSSRAVVMLEEPEGVRFVKVHRVFASSDECYGFYRDRVRQDYGTQWYRKTVRDTVTTLTAELKPDVKEINNVPLASDVAFTVNGHAVTFGDCHAYLPFLLGDTRRVEFWQSVQRQALEIELFYQSERGKQIRKSEDFMKLMGFVGAIAEAESQLLAAEKEGVTTEALLQYYDETLERYTEVQSVTGKLYECTASDTDERLECAACLSTLPVPPGCGAGVAEKSMVKAPWGQFGREFQYAAQNLEAGEWSAVFTQEGVPCRFFMEALERDVKAFDDVAEQVRYNFQMDKRAEFWREMMRGDKARSGAQKGK